LLREEPLQPRREQSDQSISGVFIQRLFTPRDDYLPHQALLVTYAKGAPKVLSRAPAKSVVNAS
jgi:hypothetical protein